MHSSLSDVGTAEPQTLVCHRLRQRHRHSKILRGSHSRRMRSVAGQNESVTGNELGLSSSAVRPNVSVALQLAQLTSASCWI